MRAIVAIRLEIHSFQYCPSPLNAISLAHVPARELGALKWRFLRHERYRRGFLAIDEFWKDVSSSLCHRAIVWSSLYYALHLAKSQIKRASFRHAISRNLWLRLESGHVMQTAGLQIERLWMAYNSSDSLRSWGGLHSSLEEFVSLGNSDRSRQKFGESTPARNIPVQSEHNSKIQDVS